MKTPKISASAKIAVIGFLVLSIAGCSNLNTREQRALSGGAIGAIGGAAVGLVAGGPFLGAFVGGAAGAAVGAYTNENQVRIDPKAGN